MPSATATTTNARVLTASGITRSPGSRRSTGTPIRSRRSRRTETIRNTTNAGIGGSATASSLIVFWMPRIEFSMSARLFSIWRCLSSSIFVRATCRRRFSTDFQILDHHVLGLIVQIGARADFADRAVQAGLRFFQPLIGLGFGLFGIAQALCFVVLGPRFHRLQRALSRPPFAQRDERRVAGKLVHRIQQEGDVVEIQVLDAAAAQVEELLAHQVDIGDDDGSQVHARP